MAVSANTAANLGWITGAISLFVLFVRLGTHRYLVGRLDASAYVVVLSAVVLAARIACNHYVLTYGTISGLVDDSTADQYTPFELSRVHEGTTLTLVTRLLVTTFYWLQCGILLLVYERLVSHIPWVRHAIRVCWVVIGITYIAVALTTFLECHPFELYYSLAMPECSKAYAQLWVQCLSNVSIDLILLGISAPIMREQIRLFPKNLQLGAIFILGFFCIVITCLRMSFIYESSSAQPTRSLWASNQALVATIVANVPSIYGALKLWRRKGRGGSSSSSSLPIMGSISLQRPSHALPSQMEEAHIDDNKRDSFHTFLYRTNTAPSKVEEPHIDDIKRDNFETSLYKSHTAT